LEHHPILALLLVAKCTLPSRGGVPVVKVLEALPPDGGAHREVDGLPHISALLVVGEHD
jgi:hypothetical protein